MHIDHAYICKGTKQEPEEVLQQIIKEGEKMLEEYALHKEVFLKLRGEEKYFLSLPVTTDIHILVMNFKLREDADYQQKVIELGRWIGSKIDEYIAQC